MSFDGLPGIRFFDSIRLDFELHEFPVTRDRSPYDFNATWSQIFGDKNIFVAMLGVKQIKRGAKS